MGQVESQAAAPEDEKNPSSANSSLDSLTAEAAAFGDEDENLWRKKLKEHWKECPCIAHLRTDPCGSHFSDAFVFCFLKSNAPEKAVNMVERNSRSEFRTSKPMSKNTDKFIGFRCM